MPEPLYGPAESAQEKRLRKSVLKKKAAETPPPAPARPAPVLRVREGAQPVEGGKDFLAGVGDFLGKAAQTVGETIGNIPVSGPTPRVAGKAPRKPGEMGKVSDFFEEQPGIAELKGDIGEFVGRNTPPVLGAFRDLGVDQAQVGRAAGAMVPTTPGDVALSFVEPVAAIKGAKAAVRGAKATTKAVKEAAPSRIAALKSERGAIGPGAAGESARFTLPRDLAGAKPRFKTSEIAFESDMDKTLYILAQDTKSKSDAKYLKAAMQATGLDEQALRTQGRTVRERVKMAAKATPEGEAIVVPSSGGMPKPAPAPQFQVAPVQATKPKLRKAEATDAQLGPARPSVSGGVIHDIYIAGKKEGEVNLSIEGAKARIKWLGRADTEGAPPPPLSNVLGSTGLKKLLEDFKRLYPDVTEIGGERMGGARYGRPAERSLALERPVQAPAVAEPPQPPQKPPTAQGGPGAEPPMPPKKDGDFAANIRLEKYPEDVREEIRTWAAANPETVQTARRGVRSDAQVREDAQAIALEVGAKRWKAGAAWNAEEITALRGVLRQRTEAVKTAAATVRGANTTENHAKLLTALQEQARVQEIVHGVTAEAGRALRAFRQEVMEIAQSDNPTALLERLLKKYGHDGTRLDEIARRLAELDDLGDPVKVHAFIRNIWKPTAWDYLNEYYINSILSGPSTHLVNAISNTISTLVSPVERGAAALVEQGLARAQGRKAERFFSEAPADLFGAVQGMQEGTRAMVQTMRTGIRPTGTTSKLDILDVRPKAFRGKLGRVINAPTTALEAADAFFYTANYRAALNAGALRAAKREGLTGRPFVERVQELLAEPPLPLMQKARETAEYRLYRNDPGETASLIMRLRETKYGKPLRFVVPFVRTPVNLLKFGLERSPAGFLNPSLWNNLAAKSPETADQIGRALLGSMVAAAVAWKVTDGAIEITGAAPKSEAERDRFYREGKLPYAIKIGGTWVQFRRLEPFNTPLTMVAAVTDAVERGEGDTQTIALEAAFSIGRNMMDQTYLMGLADFLEAIDEPERFAERYIQRLATGFLPASSLLRQTATTVDPVVRQPETLEERVQAGVPGMTQNVPPRLTAFGEEARRQSPPVLPIQVSQAQRSAVDKELGRLKVEVGFVGDSIGGAELSREDKALYQRLAGQKSYELLASAVASAGWAGVPDTRKEEIIQTRLNDAREWARLQVLRQRRGIQAQTRQGAVIPGVPTPQSTPGGARTRPATAPRIRVREGAVAR